MSAPTLEVEFMTVAEVASGLRVSKMTVYRLIHTGELPAARIGRSFRVTKIAVKEYLRACQEGNHQPQQSGFGGVPAQAQAVAAR